MQHVEVDPNTNNPAGEEYSKKLLHKNKISIIIMDGADVQVILDMTVNVCVCPCMYLFVCQCVCVSMYNNGLID